MKELYILSTNLGFIPQNISISWKTDSYLWMCELQKWLRENHNIIVMVEPYSNGSSSCRFIWDRFILNNIWMLDSFSMEKHEKYEKALEIGLYESIKLIK